jgi:phosphate transport system permease protein
VTLTATAPSPAPQPPRLEDTRRSAGQRTADTAFRLLLLFCLSVGLVFLVILLTSVIWAGWPRLSLDFITNMPSRRPERAGVQSAIMGSIWVTGFTALFCIPTGVLASIYLEEYADKDRWWNRLIELNLQNLAAVPAIVFGILGLGIIARRLGFGFTVLTASLTLSLLVLPTVIVASREAIRAVPGSIRDGSFALGATRWQTVWRQVLPAAVPGMATGSILALSRAFGEAAPLILLGGVSFITFNPEGLQSRYTTLPILIYNWTLRPQEEFRVAASAAIVVLLVVLLAMNSLAIFLRNKYQTRW